MHHRLSEFAFPTLYGSITFFFGLLAQDGSGSGGGSSLERWGSMGAAVVISCLLAYIITQRDPKAQEKVAALIESLTEKHTSTMRAQTTAAESAIKHITDKSMAAVEKIQQENAIATQGIVKDCKELMQTTVKQLGDEKISQRKDLIEHFNRIFDILRGDRKEQEPAP